MTVYVEVRATSIGGFCAFRRLEMRRTSSCVVLLAGLEDLYGQSRRASMLDKRDQFVEVVPLVPRHASRQVARETGLNELRPAPPHHGVQISGLRGHRLRIRRPRANGFAT
jgi:hypothetical protein